MPPHCQHFCALHCSLHALGAHPRSATLDDRAGWLARLSPLSSRDSRACSWCVRRRGAAGAGRGAERQDISERSEKKRTRRELEGTDRESTQPPAEVAARPRHDPCVGRGWRPHDPRHRVCSALRRKVRRAAGAVFRSSLGADCCTAGGKNQPHRQLRQQLRSGPRSAFQRRSGPHVQLVWAVGRTDGHTPCGHGLPGALQVAAGRG